MKVKSGGLILILLIYVSAIRRRRSILESGEFSESLEASSFVWGNCGLSADTVSYNPNEDHFFEPRHTRALQSAELHSPEDEKPD